MKSTNAAGYTYECRTILDTAIADPLAEMRALLVGKTKLLPGPVVVTPQAAKATEPAKKVA